MLLRRSGEISEESYNLSGVLGDDDVGVEDEGLLVAIAEAVFAGDPIDLAHIRAEAVRSIGAEKFVDAIGIASGFNGITKVANATASWGSGGLGVGPAIPVRMRIECMM